MARAGKKPEAFVLDIEKYVQDRKKDIDQFAVEFPQEVARQIVEATPVKTGNLRASWYARWQGRTFRFLNATSYGPHLEFGTSRMAPRAFVRGVLDRADQIAHQVHSRIKRG